MNRIPNHDLRGGYEYDGYGRLKKEIVYSGTSTPYTGEATTEIVYDATMGNRVSYQQDPKAQKINYGYDKAGRVTSISYQQSGGSYDGAADFEYDKAGRVKKVTVKDCPTCSATELDRFYTANGLPATKENVFGGNIEYRYDGIDRLASVTYPGDAAPAVKYAYDAANRLTRIESDLYQSSFAYNGANQVTRITRGEIDQTPFQTSARGAQTEYGYWGHSGELGSIEHRWNLSANRKLRHKYSYNADGLHDELHITKEIPGSDANLKVTYAYDNLNRLIGEYGYDANTAGATSVYERLYHYDGSGNADRIVYYDRGVHWTGWTCDYNDQNELIYKYTNQGGYGVGTENGNRIAYQYDDDRNLTVMSKQTGVKRVGRGQCGLRKYRS